MTKVPDFTVPGSSRDQTGAEVVSVALPPLTPEQIANEEARKDQSDWTGVTELVDGVSLVVDGVGYVLEAGANVLSSLAD